MVDRNEYLASLDKLEQSRQAVETALEIFGGATRAVRDAVQRGELVSDALQQLHWIGIRRGLEEEWSAFQTSLYDARCYAVAIMVDDEGLSLSEIARMRGLSRQLISRLYRDAHERRNENDA